MVEHPHNHDHNNSRQGLTIAFWLNLIFSIIELIGGILTNSTAIIADSFHDFTDAIAIGLAVWLERFSQKKRTSNFSYGYRRFSLLSALGLSIFLIIGAVIMTYKAVENLYEPSVIDSVGMLFLAILGIIVNAFAFFKVNKTNEPQNHNSRAIQLHLLEDILGWVSVLIGAAIIYFTQWYWIDSILAIGIAIFISYNAIKNLIDSMKIMLQAVPDDISIENISKDLLSINGISDIHDLHIWTIDGSYNIASLHAVIIDSSFDSATIHSNILEILKIHNIHHSTIQIENIKHKCDLTQC